MMLEVGRGDAVTVVARGEDAAAAVDAVLQALSSASAAVHGGEPRQPSGTPPTGAVPARPTSMPGGPLTGVPASPGVAIGRVFQLRHADEVLEERAADPSHERRALDAAIAGAHRQLEALRLRLTAEEQRPTGSRSSQRTRSCSRIPGCSTAPPSRSVRVPRRRMRGGRPTCSRRTGCWRSQRAARRPGRRPARRRPARAPSARGSRWHAARSTDGVDRRSRGPGPLRRRDAGSHPRAGLLHYDGQRHLTRGHPGAGAGRPRGGWHGSARARASLRRPGSPRW